MPPRRSARATSAKPSAPPEDKPLSSKRKRNETGPDQDEVVKPSTSRKPPSARSNAAATSTRSRTSVHSRSSLKEVPESDEDPEDTPPPTKKKRPSAVLEPKPEGGESSEEIQEILPPVRRAPPVRKSATKRGTKKGKEVAQKEEDSEPEVPTSRARQVPAASTRRSNRSSVQLQEERISIVISDSDEENPALKARNPPSKAVPAPKEEDESEEEPPMPNGRRPASTSGTAALKPINKSRRKVESSSEEEAEPKFVVQAQPVVAAEPEHVSDAVESELPPVPEVEKGEEEPTPGPADKEPSDKPMSEMEEEHTLLDPPNVPPRNQPAPSQPEEPKGPQARLVIHKMALINFKSYAGRQEIGPFHKVLQHLYNPNDFLNLNSLFLRSSAPTGPESRTPSTPCCSYLDIALPR